MNSTKDFANYYKNSTNTELIDILQNPGEYRPAAIEAARNELHERCLSENDIYEANQILQVSKQQEETRKRKARELEKKFKDTGSNFLRAINPFHPGLAEEERIIRSTITWFGIIFFYLFLSNYETAGYFLETLAQDTIGSIVGLMPYLFLPIALIAFGLRKRFGWILLAGYLAFSAVSFLFLLLFSYVQSVNDSSFYITTTPEEPSRISMLIPLIVLSITLYAICKTGVRNIYRIKKEIMIAIPIVSGLIGFFMIYYISK